MSIFIDHIKGLVISWLNTLGKDELKALESEFESATGKALSILIEDVTPKK